MAGVYPWPSADGYRQRLSNTVEAFIELGDVDLACFTAAVDPGEAPPPDGIRLVRGRYDVVPTAERVQNWVRGDRPRALYRYDARAANAVVAAELAERYDLVFLSHISSWAWHRDLRSGPTIVDLDNLEHIITRATRTHRPRSRDARVWGKWVAQQPVEWVDEHRMDRIQRECARSVDLVTLCSEIDVARSGMANARMLANGYDRQAEPPAERSGATMLFVGGLTYGPNADAVRWFATEVLPLVRRVEPSATFRVVGGGADALGDVRHVDGVAFAGRVDEVQPELDAAAIAVIPIRFGSGTRLKVVEALANRLPMVSTHLGSEGIGVVDGESALLADTPAAFADACVRLLRDGGLRSKIADHGEALWDARYRWSQLRGELAEMGREVASASSR